MELEGFRPLQPGNKAVTAPPKQVLTSRGGVGNAHASKQTVRVQKQAEPFIFASQARGDPMDRSNSQRLAIRPEPASDVSVRLENVWSEVHAPEPLLSETEDSKREREGK